MPKKKIKGENSRVFVQKPSPSILNNTMQTTFSSKKYKEEKQKAILEAKKREEQLQQAEIKQKAKEEESFLQNKNITNSSPADVQKQIIDYHESQDKQEKQQQKPSAFRRLKSFKEMSIDEKLIYLLNFPKQLPPVPCVIITESQNARGFVIGKDDHSVQLKLMNESVMKIALKSIQEVKMIGL